MKTERCLYNLTELSRRTGIPQTTLSDRWRKPGDMKLYEIEAIADALGMTIEQVVAAWKKDRRQGWTSKS